MVQQPITDFADKGDARNDKKKVLELLQNDVLDIELKNCKATDISERITELTDRITEIIASVRYGKWEKLKDGYWCSNCCICDDYKEKYRYCPNCGARMKMESDNNG